jgi:hypothetical protein
MRLPLSGYLFRHDAFSVEKLNLFCSTLKLFKGIDGSAARCRTSRGWSGGGKPAVVVSVRYRAFFLCGIRSGCVPGTLWNGGRFHNYFFHFDILILSSYQEIGVETGRDASIMSRSPSDAPIYEISAGNIRPADIDKLTSIFVGQDDKQKISIDFNNHPSSQNCEWILNILEKYHTFITNSRQMPIHSSPRNNRVQSRFHTLGIDEEIGRDAVERVLQSMQCLALFDAIHLILCDSRLLGRIKDIVLNEGVISSLYVSRFTLLPDDVLHLGRMMKGNCLESLGIRFFNLSSNLVASVVASVLTRSVKLHLKTFARDSILRTLTLDKITHGMNFRQRLDLFNVIGVLPSLQYLTIETDEADFFEPLAASIGSWKVRLLKLTVDCFFPIRDNVPPPVLDMGSFCDAIARSGLITAFRLMYNPPHEMPARVSRQLFDLAISTTSQLQRIELLAVLPLLSTLVPEILDPRIAVECHLRQFTWLMDCNITDQAHVLSSYLNALLWLLSKRLPYLHDIGTLPKELKEYASRRTGHMTPDILDLLNQVGVQIERNRVGMTLFEPHVMSHVPQGLWPRVLSLAVDYGRHHPKEDVPWTGIYQMVHAMAENDLLPTGGAYRIIRSL